MPKNIMSPGNLVLQGQNSSPEDLNNASIYGDGSDGSYNSGNNLEPGKVYNFTDFTLNSGDTLTSTTNSNEPMVILVQGDVDISGTIDLKAKSNGGILSSNIGIKSNGGNGGFGQEDNAGSGGDGGGQYPSDEYFVSHSNLLKVPPGTNGGNGGDGSYNGGGGGGGGGAAYDANGGNGQSGNSGGDFSTADDDGIGGAGGDGSQSLILVCGGNLSISGTIDLRGEDGEDGIADRYAAGGGGGGGGAGSAHILYKGTLTDNGTKLAAGGNGGNGPNPPDNSGDGGNGGNGANGTIIFESVA